MNKKLNIEVNTEKLVFAQKEEKILDQKLDTKSRTYLQDAWFRFKRNKASIVAAIIISFMFLYAIIVPMVSQYSVSFNDAVYSYAMPRNQFFVDLGLGFWDGGSNKVISENMYIYYTAIEAETGDNIIMGDAKKIEELNVLGKATTKYEVRLDSYLSVGMSNLSLISYDQYMSIQAYQDKTGIQVLYPITNPSLRPSSDVTNDGLDANYWYKTTTTSSQLTIPDLDDDGNLQNIYKTYTGTDGYTSTVRYEGDTAMYDYSIKKGDTYEVRLHYYEYFTFYNSYYLDNGITHASFLFGATQSGQDIFTCLAAGARFSFLLAIIVAVVNFVVGVIFGAIEGYYGGKVDMLMQRFVELLNAVPMMIIFPLLKYHFDDVSNVLLLFLAFFATGWVGISGTTRMQFYRYKNQEYVLAARTLGAKDRRIMTRHIFPNAIGTLITRVVLVIPGVILAETSLSYLGIINLNSPNRTSVGTLLANAQPYLSTFPHMILFPALFISLLILSFNLFGNGLRDAFNPSLRGMEG